MHNNLILDVSVCLCTYKRAALLSICLKHLFCQTTARSYEIIVVDNDAEGSAKDIVNSFQAEAGKRRIRLRCFIEPEQNIALARNKGVAACDGEYIAFIDDDEYAAHDWLERLFNTLVEYRADGVFGPVHPVFFGTFPKWLKNSRLFDRPRLKTGSTIRGEYRTGNAMISKIVLSKRLGPFNSDYGKTGGEDTDLFNWLQSQGCTFLWCDEAIVYEVQDENRISIVWHLRRGYRGGWVYARQSCATKGFFYGGLSVLARGILASFKILLKLILHLHNPRVAVFFFLRDMAGQLGKVGFFFKCKPEEYKER